MADLISTPIRTLAIVLLLTSPVRAANSSASAVDFRYSPPEWQTAICLPDDPQKSLVDRSGELLYHYNQGGREFGTRIGVQVVGDSVWQEQDLYSPRVPIVRTQRAADGLEIIEEAFAVTDLRQTGRPTTALRRVDGGGENRNWAKPPAGADPSLQDIAVHMGGNIAYEVTVPPGASRRIALALCEGWWSEAGKRIQVLRDAAHGDGWIVATPEQALAIRDGERSAAVVGDAPIVLALDAHIHDHGLDVDLTTRMIELVDHRPKMRVIS